MCFEIKKPKNVNFVKNSIIVNVEFEACRSA